MNLELPPAQFRALELMLSSATNSPVDHARAVLALRATNGHPDVKRLILENRRHWLTWLTVTQREWQAKPRTITERDIERRVLARTRIFPKTGFWAPDANALYGSEAAALIESVQMRERYVRC